MLISLTASPLQAENNYEEKRVYYAQFVNLHPPQIDGLADDPAWEAAEWAGDFIQRQPYEGYPPSQQTVFKVLYDAKNLYVLIRAYDTEPEKIERRVTRRDIFSGDMVEINIDSYYDHRTAFSFTINAAGSKGDELISNDGANWDTNWDPVWFGKVSIDSLGWIAEIRIPFSQLRFSKSEVQVWGFQVMRHYFRNEERSFWQPIPRKAGGWVSYFGELRGIRNIGQPRRIELLPYTVTDMKRFEREAGNPFRDGQTERLSTGLNVKLGLSSDFTLDMSINPDFGQVEADPSEINLSAFETFFSEKRPFFIEGQNIFEFPLMLGDGPFSNDRLFYTRRIGRPPRYTPSVEANAFLDMPATTSIAVATKLSGKTSSGLSIGVLDALTREEYAHIATHDSRYKEAVDPATNYLLGRLQKDFDKGNTSIGGMVTATHRKIDSEQLRFLNTAAYSSGFDFRHQWDDKTYLIDFRLSFSHIRGHEEAIQAAQLSSARYFQRPDADYVDYDPQRTSLSGHGGFLSFARGGNSALQFSVGTMWRSPGLELNDMGFLRQADRIMQWVWAGYRVTDPVSVFRRIFVNFNQWMGWDFGGNMNFSGGNINANAQLTNFWSLGGGIGYEFDGLSTTLLRGGPAIKTPGQLNYWMFLSTDQRKPLSLRFSSSTVVSRHHSGRFRSFNTALSYRPSNALSFRINAFLNTNRDVLQYLAEASMDGSLRYLFGEIDQKTLGLTVRINLSLTPSLSIQYYGQPFISAGSYNHFKWITAPKADRFADRFVVFSEEELIFNAREALFEVDEDSDGESEYSFEKPDFNFRQFRSNLIFRWEYFPGSTLFVVWSQSRTGFLQDGGHFSPRQDLGALFNIYPENIFLIKLSRWFSL